LPLYEYKCVKCGHRFEKIEKLSAPTTQKCPKCGKKAERQLSSPAIQFKGSGWYVTDYGGKKGAPSGESSGDGSSAKAEASSDAKSSDSKSSESKDSKESKPASSDSSNKGASKRKK
jgi:putative FmdB family regulatory protein